MMIESTSSTASNQKSTQNPFKPKLPKSERIRLNLEQHISETLKNHYSSPKFLIVHGRKVFYKESNVEDKTSCTVLIHGIPTSSADYAEILEKSTGYTLTFDFVGLGISDKPLKNYCYSILEHCDTLIDVLRQRLAERESPAFRESTTLKTHKIKFISHDMGDSVLCELLTRRQRKILPEFLQNSIKSVYFTNGGMYYSHIDKRITQRLAANSFFGNVLNKILHANTNLYQKIHKHQIGTLFSTRTRSSPKAVQYLSDLAYLNRNFHDGTGAQANQLIQYSIDRSLFEYRWHDALRELDIPCRLVWGTEDGAACTEMAVAVKGLNENIELVLLEKIGHFWMVECEFDEFKGHFDL